MSQKSEAISSSQDHLVQDFFAAALASLREYLPSELPDDQILKTRLADLDVDSLDLIEWEISIYDQFTFTKDLDYLNEMDTVDEILGQYAALLEGVNSPS